MKILGEGSNDWIFQQVSVVSQPCLTIRQDKMAQRYRGWRDERKTIKTELEQLIALYCFIKARVFVSCFHICTWVHIHCHMYNSVYTKKRRTTPPTVTRTKELQNRKQNKTEYTARHLKKMEMKKNKKQKQKQKHTGTNKRARARTHPAHVHTHIHT